MSRPKQQPAALTIAGSDSGGGAGVPADLKTFAALGVHGTSAVTCLTAQNPRRVLAIQAARPEIVQQQIEAVFEEFQPRAVKTGMLFSAEIIRVVAGFFRNGKRPPLIVDPVGLATSGARLLKPSAVKLLQEKLLPCAALVTPNLDEVELLLGWRADTEEKMRRAAREFHERWGCAALIKGGHLPRVKTAPDIFYDGQTELLLTAPFAYGLSTHGTGCTYSAAITSFLALDHDLPHAVQQAKEYITQAIHQSRAVGRHTVLNHFWRK